MLDELIARALSLGRLLNACSRSGCRLRQSIRKLIRVYRALIHLDKLMSVSGSESER